VRHSPPAVGAPVRTDWPRTAGQPDPLRESAAAIEATAHADVRAIALHCPEGPLKSRPNNDEFRHSSRSSVTSTFRADLEAP
jgi:hypothetical protein